VRVTEGNAKIISEILVEINGNTGVHVQYVETDPGEYYKIFLRNEEDIRNLGVGCIMYDRNMSSEKAVECFSHRIFMSPRNITEDILMIDAPVMLQMRAGI
jgi:hypothetical protein